MRQFFNIILGITILGAGNLLVTVSLILFYFKVAKISEIFLYKMKLSLFLCAVNILMQFLALVAFAGTGLMPYVAITFILSLIGYLGVLKFGYKYHLLENTIIAVSLAIILNPIWLNLFGILT